MHRFRPHPMPGTSAPNNVRFTSGIIRPWFQSNFKGACEKRRGRGFQPSDGKRRTLPVSGYYFGQQKLLGIEQYGITLHPTSCSKQYIIFLAACVLSQSGCWGQGTSRPRLSLSTFRTTGDGAEVGLAVAVLGNTNSQHHRNQAQQSGLTLWQIPSGNPSSFPHEGISIFYYGKNWMCRDV